MSDQGRLGILVIGHIDRAWRLLVGFAILASTEWVRARAKSEARNLNLSQPHKGNQP